MMHAARATRGSLLAALVLLGAGLSTGCAPDRQRQIEVLSEPPGARIEVNGDFVGCAPTVIPMVCDSGGRVDADYSIHAYPSGPEYYPQTKAFLKRVGGDSDAVPKRIYFDMRVHQPTNVPSTQPRRQPAWP